MDSEREKYFAGERGEKRLHELTAEFLRSRDPGSPDPDLVGHLYIATFQYIVLHLGRDAGDQEFAEDAVQEAFKALQSHFQQHKSMPEQPMAFLLTVARNYLRKRGRNEARRGNSPIDAIESVVLERVLRDPREPAREAFDAVASSEIREVANRAMDELDATTRRIIKLRREGKEWEAIARIVKLGTDATKKRFQHAVAQVQAGLGAHFSSFVTSADAWSRRWISSRKSAGQAIDLLPPPYAETLHLLLVEKMTLMQVAALRETSPEGVKRERDRGLELFHKKYGMTENDLLSVLEHGK